MFCVACIVVLLKLLISVCISIWIVFKNTKVAMLAVALILLAFVLSRFNLPCDLAICKP